MSIAYLSRLVLVVLLLVGSRAAFAGDTHISQPTKEKNVIIVIPVFTI